MKFGEKTQKVREYTEALVDSVGCGNTPPREMYTEEELKMLIDSVYEDRTMAVLYALFIGFSNGVKWGNEQMFRK